MGVKTYIAYDNNYYKIGRSENPEKRIESMKTANPAIRLICYGEGDKEKFLHERYESCRVSREWFDLTDEQLNEIIETISAKLTRFTEIKKVIDFGKYKGLQLCELRSPSQIAYMKWYIENKSYNDNWSRLFEIQIKRLETFKEKFKEKKKKRIRTKKNNKTWKKH